MDPRPSSQELETVAELRLALRRFLAATDEVTASQGLTARQYDLLALLHRPHQGQLTPGRVARELSLSKSAATELLSRAARAGLVRRETDAGDERIKNVTPTQEGTRRFYAAVHDLREDRARLFGLLRVAAGLAAALSTIL